MRNTRSSLNAEPSEALSKAIIQAAREAIRPFGHSVLDTSVPLASYPKKRPRPRIEDERARRDLASRLVPNTTSQNKVVTPKLPGVLA